MSVSRVAGGTAFRDRSKDSNKPRRHRFGLFLVLSLAVGGCAGIYAFATLYVPTLFTVFHVSSTQPEIAASMIFPSPDPIQQTVNVYDPPVAEHEGGGGGGGDRYGHDTPDGPNDH